MSTLGWLGAAAMIILCTRMVGGILHRLRVPFVVGELLGGLVLGVLASGSVGGLAWFAITSDVQRTIDDVAEVAVVILMLEVGYDIRNKTRHVLGSQHLAKFAAGSLLIPSFAGLCVALLTPTMVLPPDGRSSAYILLCSAVFAVTALPILALLLVDMGIMDTLEARLALSAAAVSDVAAWLFVGIAVALQASSSIAQALSLVAILGAAGAFTTWLRPLLLAAGRLEQIRSSVSVLLGLVLLSAGVAHLGGAHPAIVSLIVGASIADPTGRLRPAVDAAARGNLLILMPFFVVQLGFSFDVGIFASPWIVLGALFACVVSLVSKVAGGLVGSVGVNSIPTMVVIRAGVLGSSKGLTELLVLSTAMQTGIIGPVLYSVGVAMTIVNTVLVAPLLGVLLRYERRAATMLLTR